MTLALYRRLALLAALLALGVVALGAYVRLSDAGLGCPDWPGCYGHLVGVPDAPTSTPRRPGCSPTGRWKRPRRGRR